MVLVSRQALALDTNKPRVISPVNVTGVDSCPQVSMTHGPTTPSTSLNSVGEWQPVPMGNTHGKLHWRENKGVPTVITIMASVAHSIEMVPLFCSLVTI